MIRANLLPRPKERIAVAGIDVDAEYVRQAFLGLCVVLAVVAIGVGIELLRISRFDAAAAAQEARIAADAPRRAQVKALALDVAHYQSFAREAQAYRRSGSDVAIALAKIGNSVPAQVWLDSLDRQNQEYTVAGGATSVDRLGGTIVSLGGALPQTHAALVNLDNRQADGNGVHFTARIAGPPPPDLVKSVLPARVMRAAPYAGVNP